MESLDIPDNHPALRAYLGRRAAEARFAAAQTQKPYVHAEVQLFFHALGNEIKYLFPYMGASKLPCVLCAELLRASGIFACRTTHKHFYPKWMVPGIDSLPPPAQEWTLEVLAEVKDTLRTSLLLPGRTKGDLRPESTADMTTVTQLDAGLDCGSPELSIAREKQRELRDQQMLSRLFDHQLSGIFNIDQEVNSVNPDYSSNSLQDDKSDSDEYVGECGGCPRLTSRRCGRCGNDLFCSTSCEAQMGPNHKFRCSNGPVTTADLLEYDCYRDRLPEDHDVLRDFGFESLPSATDRAKLLGLYKGIFSMEINADEVHQWQCAGSLRDQITFAFEQRPIEFRGGYFPWFVENQDRIFPLHTRQEPEDETLEMFFKPARFLLEPKDRLIRVKHLEPTVKRNCFLFAALIVQMQYPSPDAHGPYHDFGFCACQSLSEEGALTSLYQELILGPGYDPEQLIWGTVAASDITVSRFVQFCVAYETGRLLQYMDANGLHEARKKIRHLTTFLSGIEETRDLTVWKLLTFLKSEDEAWPPTDVSIDFRFLSCDALGRVRLKKFYSSLVARADVIQLQQAQATGQLLDFARRYGEVESDIADILR